MSKFKSQSFIYYRPGDVRLGELDINCGPTDIIVKVLASARCGTDKTIFKKGHPKVDPHAPIVLGHELVGEIVEVGKKVKSLRNGIGYKEGEKLDEEYLNFQPGERVTLQSRIARYKNGLMLLRDPITILSFYINGGYSQYMKIPKELIRSGSVLRVAKHVSDEEGVLVEPAACALESIFSTPHPIGIGKEGRHIFQAGIKKGGICCIIGSGTVSMIYALLAKTEGASQVFIIVRSEEKAKLVRQVLGNNVIPIIGPSYNNSPISEREKIENRLVKELGKKTEGKLFDDVIVACPDSNAQRLMLRLYNPEGYAVGACFGGTHEKVDQVDMDRHHYQSAKTIGTSGCSTKSMETILNWLEKGKISLRGFVSKKRYTLKTNPEEFFTTNADGLKPVLYPWE